MRILWGIAVFMIGCGAAVGGIGDGWPTDDAVPAAVDTVPAPDAGKGSLAIALPARTVEAAAPESADGSPVHREPIVAPKRPGAMLAEADAGSD